MAFQQYKTMLENPTSLKIKALQTDNGKEYLSYAFTQILQSHCIIHRLTCPYIHKQNGKMESKNRHLTKRDFALLAIAPLPLIFWIEAFTSITYLINRLPSPTTNNLPSYELIHE